MTCLSALLLALALAGHEPEAPRLERRFLLLGTEVHLSLYSELPRAELLAASEHVRQALVQTEARLSTWRADSELARLNDSPVDLEVPLSPELSAELATALACREATGGAFDPEVGRLVAAWGLRNGGRWPADEEIRALAAEASEPGIELDARGHRAWRRGDKTLEEGAWGKGAALDRALAALGPDLTVVIDLGGQLLQRAGRPTAVAVAHPVDRRRELVEITVEDGSVATSGNGERGLEVAGRSFGHLLDPRTGRPARDFGSVTVWAPTGLEADCLSTGLFVLGPEAALLFAASHPRVAVVVVETTPGDPTRVRASANLRGRLRALDPAVTLEFSSAPERPEADKDEGAGTSATTAGGSDSPMNRGDRASTRPPLDSTGV